MTGYSPVGFSHVLSCSLMNWPVNCDMFACVETQEHSQRLSLLEIDMQLKLKLTVVAAIAAAAGVASAQEQVVKIGHVAPVSGAQAHYGKDNENGARMGAVRLHGSMAWRGRRCCCPL